MRLRLLTALAVGLAAAAAFAQGGDAGKAKGHRFIGASWQGTGTIWIVDADGNVEWEKKVGECLDVSLLPNGNVFYAARWTTPHRHKEPAVAEVDRDGKSTVAEVDRDGKVVWEHTVNGEIYSAQRLANGNTVINENTQHRITEVDPLGRIVHEVPIVPKSHPHNGPRHVRKTDAGTYLVCLKGEGAVREYDPQGRIVRSFKVPKPMGVSRLANGNTLVATADRTIVEFDKDCKEVWKITDADLPADLRPQKGGYRGLCAERLKNGNTVASFEGVLVEFAPDKSIVWRSRSFIGLMGFQLID